MLSSVKISLALVSLLILVHVNEAFPMKEWLPRRSMVKDEDSAIEQRFDEDSYSSPTKILNEDDKEEDMFADDGSERNFRKKDFSRQYQCRFGGCGK